MGKKKRKQQPEHPPKASRRDLLLIVAATFAVSLLISIAIPVGCAVSLTNRHHRFIQDLGSSLTYAREHKTLELNVDGETREGELSQAEAVYGLIYDTGMGSPLSEAPSGKPIAFFFGDGTSLQLFSTQIEEADGKKVEGLAVCYQRKNGSTFAYDTDKLTYRDIATRVE